MTKFRLLVKGSKAFKPSNGSSSSNSKVTKHRNVARYNRLVNISTKTVMDDRLCSNEVDVDSEAELTKHLPLHDISLEENYQQKNEKDEMFEIGRNKISCEYLDTKKMGKHDQILWKLVPSNLLLSCNLDFRITLPMFVPILGAALNEPEYCCIALASIRAALQIDKDNDLKIMEQYAKNLLPILFSIYTNGIEDWTENDKKVVKIDPNAVHQSTLATIRLYMHFIPKSLLKKYIGIATTKLIENNDDSLGEEIISDQKFLLADLLTAMCISADLCDLQTIFYSIKPWFEYKGSSQKKAYRLVSQIYLRINEHELKPFFTDNQLFLKQIINSDVEKIGRPSLSWRIVIYRNVINSLNNLDQLVEFCDSIYNELIDHLNTINSKTTRQQSGNCLIEMSEGLLRLWAKENSSSCKPNPLDALFGKLFVTIKRDLNVNTLMALNILTRKHLRHLSSALVAQLIDCISEVLVSAKEASVRLLSIRLMRTTCSKMQPFIFDQYKNIILMAVFSQSTSCSTVRIRKANSLMFDLLISLLGVEEMLSFIKSNGNAVGIWIKMLKNSDKLRRRKQRRKVLKKSGISSGIKKKFFKKSEWNKIPSI